MLRPFLSLLFTVFICQVFASKTPSLPNQYISAISPSGTNLNNSDFQQRVSYNDYVWYAVDREYGTEWDLQGALTRVGWRLNNDDNSTVIHSVCLCVLPLRITGY